MTLTDLERRPRYSETTRASVPKPDYVVPAFSSAAETVHFGQIKAYIDTFSKPTFKISDKGIFLVYQADEHFVQAESGEVEFRDDANSLCFKTPFTYSTDATGQDWVHVKLVDFALLSAHLLVEPDGGHTIDDAIQLLQHYQLIDRKSVRELNAYLDAPVEQEQAQEQEQEFPRLDDINSDLENLNISRRQFLKYFLGLGGVLVIAGLTPRILKMMNTLRDKRAADGVADGSQLDQIPAAPKGGAPYDNERRRLEQEISDAEKALLWNASAIASPYVNYVVTNSVPHDQFLGQDAYDIGAGRGAVIYSPINGLVTKMYTDQNGTPWIVIANSKYTVTMAHGYYTAQVGDILTIGQPIGAESNLGYTKNRQGKLCNGEPSCGNHTHINVRDNEAGKNINPLQLFSDNKTPDYARLQIAKYQILKEYFSEEIVYWLDKIFQWSDQWGVDPAMLAIIMQIESCGFPEAVSIAQAQGLFQVMPFHFYNEKGLRGPWTFTEEEIRTMQNPDNNAGQGVRYFKDRFSQANGSLGDAFAGYNGGHSVVGRSHSWSAETRRYFTWGTGMWSDLNMMAQGLTPPSPSTRERWMIAGGSTCKDARAWQEKNPKEPLAQSN